MNTIKGWLNALKAGFICFTLHPHHRNFRKRVVKNPKRYFYDVGLAMRLLRVQQLEQLSPHPMRGALFETWVIVELLKTRFNRGLDNNLDGGNEAFTHRGVKSFPWTEVAGIMPP